MMTKNATDLRCLMVNKRIGIGTTSPMNKLEVPVSDYYDGICARSGDV